jgi:hypothetical protein
MAAQSNGRRYALSSTAVTLRSQVRFRSMYVYFIFCVTVDICRRADITLRSPAACRHYYYYYYYYYYYWVYSPFVGPWPIFQFLSPMHSR